MATTKKLSETGWFYHAPAKPIQRDGPMPVPPASQIPGLSDLVDAPPEQIRKLVITEADSPYIRLAKQGGRPDLLRFRSPKPKSEEAKPYPRNDWFYQDDIKMEEQAHQADDGCYEFMLPDYMVHSNPSRGADGSPSGGKSYTPNRLPYAFDKTTAYERDGQKVNDKTVAIAEGRPAGYGVRAEKQHGKPVKAVHPMQPRERGKAPQGQIDDGIPKMKPMKEVTQESNPPMSKILAYGYARDWDEERERWEASQKKSDGRGKMEHTEYQSSMAAGTPPIRSAQRRTSAGSRRSSAKKTSKVTTPESKEPFKLSKFKSVPARTDTHLPKSQLPPQQADMSGSAPFATAASATDGDCSKGGRRKFEGAGQKQDAPFATNYPEDDTPKKHVGRRRYQAQDAQHEAPFAVQEGSPMFDSPPEPRQDAVVSNPDEGFTGRQKPIKPSDNSDVFRYDQSSADTPSRGGRRRYEQQKQDAPFATFGGGEDNRNNGTTTATGSVETPRSAGGRRKFDDKLQKQPAPFALDGERYKNVEARTDSNRNGSSNTIAGARKTERNVPPPNSSGEGQDNRSQMSNAPFALN